MKPKPKPKKTTGKKTAERNNDLVTVKEAAPAPKGELISKPPVCPPPQPPVCPPPRNAVGRYYVHKTEKESNCRNRKKSTCRYPVAYVYAICSANRTATREQILALCESVGITKNTAATRYVMWKAENP